MSDIEDYDDDLDFAFLDWFYIEDPDDEAVRSAHITTIAMRELTRHLLLGRPS